jgi:hypothetical protein
MGKAILSFSRLPTLKHSLRYSDIAFYHSLCQEWQDTTQEELSTWEVELTDMGILVMQEKHSKCWYGSSDGKGEHPLLFKNQSFTRTLPGPPCWSPWKPSDLATLLVVSLTIFVLALTPGMDSLRLGCGSSWPTLIINSRSDDILGCFVLGHSYQAERSSETSPFQNVIWPWLWVELLNSRI